MAEELTPRDYMGFLNSLASAAIRGMLVQAETLQADDPQNFPPLDDVLIFQVAALLGATVLEANPNFADDEQFPKGADEVRAQTIEYLSIVRDMSETSGVPMLFNLLAAAGGKPVAPSRLH